jgi:hypothetical protein
VGCDDWQDEKYREVFEGTLRGLERRRALDPSFGVEEVEGILRHLYIQDGNDQGGRGALQDVVIAASIAAHEQFVAELKPTSSSRAPLASHRYGEPPKE